MKHKAFWLFVLKCVAIAVVTLIAYSSALEGRYIWDDDYLVTDNVFLRSIDGLRYIWFDLGSRVQYYPLVFTTFWTGYHLWGLNPLGYHLLNIILHILNAIFLWRICCYLKIKPAYFIALIFAVHPVHVESVAWISELKNVLSGLFFLSGLRMYLSLYCPEEKWCLRFSWWRYLAAFGLYACALFSKTVTCSFIVVALLILWWKAGRIKRKDWILSLPFFGFGIAFGLMTAWMEVYRVGAQGNDWAMLWYEHIFVAARALCFYVGKLVWPYPLMFIYPRWDLHLTDPIYYLCIVAVVSSIAVAWRYRKTILGRGACAAIAYYIIVLFPALGFFKLYPMRFSFVADHFQYLASIGPLIFLVSCIGFLFRKNEVLQKCSEVLAVMIIFLYVVLVWQQGLIYRDRLTLFTDTIEKNPACWMAYNNRGSYYFDRGHFILAQEDFAKALALKTDYADAYNNQGLIALMKEDYREAIKNFDLAIHFRPLFSQAYGNRSAAYRHLGELDRALDDISIALTLNPGYLEGYNRRGVTLAMKKEYALAMKDFNHVNALSPGYTSAYINKAMLFKEMGNYDLALQELKKLEALGVDVDKNLLREYERKAKEGSFESVAD